LTHFEAKREKGVGTPFPRFPVPLHPCGPCSRRVSKSLMTRYFYKQVVEIGASTS